MTPAATNSLSTGSGRAGPLTSEGTLQTPARAEGQTGRSHSAGAGAVRPPGLLASLIDHTAPSGIPERQSVRSSNPATRSDTLIAGDGEEGCPTRRRVKLRRRRIRPCTEKPAGRAGRAVWSLSVRRGGDSTRPYSALQHGYHASEV
jgi:hypothetical protein